MIWFTTNLLCQFMNLLETQMHLAFWWFYSKATIGGQSVIFDLALRHSTLKKFESLSKSVEKHVVCIVWSLSLIWILEIVDIETFKIESLQRLIQLMLQEFGMHAMTGLFLVRICGNTRLTYDVIDHCAPRYEFISILWDITTFACYKKLLSVYVIFSFKHR